MQTTIYKKRIAFIPLMAGALALAGCTNGDYDFNEVDSTLGIGGEGIVLPVSSTDLILLDDVLDIDDTECVKLDENKNYIFYREGGDVDPAHPNIDRITISQNGAHDNRIVPFVLSSTAKGRGVKAGAPASVAVAEGELNLFNYEGDKPEEVVELKKAASESSFSLNVFFSDNLKDNVSKLQSLTLMFSSYMVLSDLTVSQDYQLVNGCEIHMKNVNPKNPLRISGKVNELDFVKGSSNTELGKLEIAGDKIMLDGQVNVRAEINTADITPTGLSSLNSMTVRSELDLSHFVVTGATGRFDPKIELDNLGDTEVGDVPSFLKEGDVVVDLANPQIIIDFSNDMDIEGDVSGTITAYKDGKVVVNDGRPAVIEVSGIHINRHPATSTEEATVTRVCICRNENLLLNKSDFDYVKAIANLSDLIRTIPDRVTFDNVTVQADATKDGSFMLGHDYTVGPKYTINAPLSFGRDARIVYTDTIDDMRDDLEDFDLTEGSYIEMTANVENRVPFELTLSAEALGVDGKPLGDKMTVNVDRSIVASQDQMATSGYTPIKITIRPNEAGAIKELDGLAIKFDGDKPVTGVTLNAENHYIKLDDIRIKVVGALMVEL